MNKFNKLASAGILMAMSANVVMADDEHAGMYAVTITNLTKGQTFTPILAASTKKGSTVYTLGSPASDELEIIAESGNSQPLANKLSSEGNALDTVSSGALLGPGQSVTLNVKMNRQFRHVSIASMLIPTNDAFIATNSIRGPKKKGHSVTVYSAVYDSGTEVNDELCVNMPGPFCGGEGFNEADGEGFVHINIGMHDIGDLASSQFDWRNPAAKIVIKRIK